MIVDKLIHPIDFDKNGKPILSICATEADMDWMRSARLSKQANSGDKKASDELEQMERSVLIKKRVV